MGKTNGKFTKKLYRSEDEGQGLRQSPVKRENRLEEYKGREMGEGKEGLT